MTATRGSICQGRRGWGTTVHVMNTELRADRGHGPASAQLGSVETHVLHTWAARALMPRVCVTLPSPCTVGPGGLGCGCQ